MHPLFAQPIAQQHHSDLVDRAKARRLASLARAGNSPAVACSEPDTIVVGAAHLAVRPIELADRDRLIRLVARMSPNSRRLRFFGPVNRLSNREVAHFVTVDHACREALVAVRAEEIIAVARYDSECGAPQAEIALTVDDAWQQRGIGSQLVRKLARLAACRRYEALTATILPENRAALALVHGVAPDAAVRWSDGTYRVTIPLVPC